MDINIDEIVDTLTECIIAFNSVKDGNDHCQVAIDKVKIQLLNLGENNDKNA
jgi:hypothetical protein